MIIILVTYLLYRLKSKRLQIIQETTIEPYTGSSKLNNTQPQTLTLVEYCIKSSLNSAYNGILYKIDCDPNNTNNILKTVLERGVRFLDFEIYSIGGEPVVGYSSTYDPENTNNEASNGTTDTSIQLNNVFKSILSFKPINITDPLFIQLRVKSQKTEIYSKIASYINQFFSGSLYSDSITDKTVLSDINNKIIIVMDIQNSNSSYSSKNDLKSLVNLETGTSLSVITTAKLLQSSPKRINVNTDGVTITLNETPPVWKLAYPDILDTANPDVKSLINQQCPNIIQCRFDLDDANLALYEQIFSNQAFVPLASAFKIASKW